MGYYRMGGFVCVLIIVLASFVSAAYISIQINTEVDDESATIAVTNLGDESARQVQILAKILDKKYESTIQDSLGVNEGFLGTFPINLSNAGIGNYPLLITVHYQDANGHPFSALSSVLVKNKENTRSEIFLDLSDYGIKDKKIVQVTAKNFGEDSKEINLRLFASDEFIVRDNPRTIVIDSKTSKDVAFEIESFGARKGSVYVLYAIAEYEKNGKHYTSVDFGNIAVLKKRTLFDSKGIFAILAVIVVIFIVMQFKRRK